MSKYNKDPNLSKLRSLRKKYLRNLAKAKMVLSEYEIYVYTLLEEGYTGSSIANVSNVSEMYISQIKRVMSCVGKKI